MNRTTAAGPEGTAPNIPIPRRRIRSTKEIQREREAAAAEAAAADQAETPAPPYNDSVEERSKSPNWRDDGSYVVGKGQTPVHTRWQKGQSGNPRGKKKGTPNTDTIIIDLMETPITVKTATGEKKMSRKAALFQRMWELAAKGDLKAAKFLFDRYGEAQGRRADKEVQEEALSEVDRDQVASFMASMRFGTDDAGSEVLS